MLPSLRSSDQRSKTSYSLSKLELERVRAQHKAGQKQSKESSQIVERHEMRGQLKVQPSHSEWRLMKMKLGH